MTALLAGGNFPSNSDKWWQKATNCLQLSSFGPGPATSTACQEDSFITGRAELDSWKASQA